MLLCLEVLYCFFVKRLLNTPVWAAPSLGPVVKEEPGPLLPVTGPAFSLTPTTHTPAGARNCSSGSPGWFSIGVPGRSGAL